jgi:signal peptidase I
MTEEQKAKLKDIFEWGYCIIIAVVLALLVRYYVGTPTIVNQTSMYPTFNNNDRLILNRLYRTCKTTPARGDIITFEAPSVNYLNGEKADLENPTAIYKNEPQGLFSKFIYNVVEYGKISYIKRVIALPGEHVQIKDGKVYINGEELIEDYLSEDVITQSEGGQFIDIIVPEGTVFAMGDNRGHSSDSRMFGCVPYKKIEGKVVLRFWPLNVFGKI